MEAEIDRLVAGLEGEFRAAVAADEDAAAWDLAFSLGQDVPVIEDVLRDGGDLVLGEARIPIEAVGHDFLEGGNWLVPLEGAVVAVGNGRPPRDCADVLLGVLRAMARSGAEVVLGVGPSSFQGPVRRATTDHVLVGDPPVAVPWSQVRYIKRVRGGSTGAP